MVIALVFMGVCIGVGVKLTPRVLKMLRHVLTTPPPSQGSSRVTFRPDVPSRSGTRASTSRPATQPTPKPTEATPMPDGVPDHLPVRVKQYFLARSEVAFLAALEACLPPGYRVFPNVRLNDLFFITTRHPGQQKGTYARLRDKHVDFLVVSLPDHQPRFAIELDGASHDNAQQQYRDAVKDVAFRSAGLPLVRLRAEGTYTPDSLREMLREHLSAVRA